ncbi:MULTISPECIES: hypothetical protein [Bacillus subtilis group]|uniref:hypothetical protein n=1 Tax=Bacillus subtilis group TaxID=653685 RepID=UPI00227FD798|nr:MULTISPECIES: hypothetical protein [Bacillus subtilis group]MCY7908306.1 hypothetical protein [Bacillus inaquosorum]MED1124352.1 hypothetical protein [Bacillus atrophaeus]
MKTKALLTIFAFLVSLFISAETKALTSNELPIRQATKQWSVKIDKPKEGNNLAKPEKGKFDTFSIEVENKGPDVATAEIYVFRDEPQSSTKFSLFGSADGSIKNQNEAISLAKSLNDGSPVRYSNLLLANKATELEVEVIWTQKGAEGRPLKETFKFSN